MSFMFIFWDKIQGLRGMRASGDLTLVVCYQHPGLLFSFLLSNDLSMLAGGEVSYMVQSYYHSFGNQS